MAHTDNQEEQQKGVSLPQLTLNPEVKKLFKNKFFRFFTENIVKKIAAITAAGTAGATLVNLLIYIWQLGYFSYFSMDINKIGYTSEWGLSNLLVKGVFSLGIGFNIYMIICIYDALKGIWKTRKLYKKKKLKDNIPKNCKYSNVISIMISGLIIIFLINFIILLPLLPSVSIESLVYSAIKEKLTALSSFLALLVSVLIMIVIEVILAIIVKGLLLKYSKSKIQMKAQQKDKYLSIHNIFVLAILDLVLIVSALYLHGRGSAATQNEFAIIDNKSAVVYQNDEYYWTVAASVDDRQLILDTRHQKAIPIENIEIAYCTFEEVYLQAP